MAGVYALLGVAMAISMCGSFQQVCVKRENKRLAAPVGRDFPKNTEAVKSSMNVLALLALTTTAKQCYHFAQSCLIHGRRVTCTVFKQRPFVSFGEVSSQLATKRPRISKWVSKISR